MSLRSFILPLKIAASGSRFNSDIEVVESFGTKQLLVNGIVQTGRYTDALFAVGLKKLHGRHQGRMDRILVLGVGGGGIFGQLSRLFPAAGITGIDIDPEIIRIARDIFHIESRPQVRLIQADARVFVRNKTKHKSRYDCVIIDIYTGNDVPGFVTSPEFLHDIGKILRKDGSMMFNYFAFTGQTEKSEQVLNLLKKYFISVIMEKNRRNIFYYARR